MALLFKKVKKYFCLSLKKSLLATKNNSLSKKKGNQHSLNVYLIEELDTNF